MNQIGRNEQCPCCSGKKYKKCHLLIFEEQATIQKQMEDQEWEDWFRKDIETGRQNLISIGENPTN
jgi:hypothetical protein